MAEKLTEKDDDKDDDIVIVEEDPSAKQQEPTGIESDDQEDARVNASNEDDDDDEIDASDKEREAIRERRRLEKQERKVRRDEAIKRDKVELDFLRKRNDDLERRLSAQEQRAHTADLRGFDAEIARAQQEVDMAEKVIAKAVAAGNGDDVAQAMRYRDAAITRAQQLTWQKQQTAQQPPTQQTAPDDVAIAYAKEFIQENPWYDTQGGNEDSAIVLAIDQSLAKDGYDPHTEDYWDELRRRAARRLPERFAPNKEPAQQKREARGGPQVGSGKEHAPTSTRKEIYISPERKQALIEAGVWDDPVLRNKYVKRYAEYDRNNKA
jgi:hypothetical protein